jgi:hypothetical protein
MRPRWNLRRSAAVLASVVVSLTVLPATSPATAADVETEPMSAENVSHVAHLDYQRRYGQSLPFGTDVEIVSMAVKERVLPSPRKQAKRIANGKPASKVKLVPRDIAFAGTYRNGLQIIDVTDPTAPRHLAVYDCALAQGDVQIFTRPNGKTYAAYTADDISSETLPESGCYSDLGITTKEYGTFIVNVTDPRDPRSVTFVPFERGSHNQTVHPSGMYLYNSNSDVIPGEPPSIEIVDITKLREPVHSELPLVTGLDSHDITFNDDGTRAYSAAINHTLVIDTTDPGSPSIIGRIVDPTINIHHQADPVTMDDPVLGERTFLVVTDELAGAAGNGVCPGGGLHVYDITGDLERMPVKVGFFDIPDVSPTAPPQSLRCTSHVLRMYPDEGVMTIAWYARGVRVIDISGLVGASVGLPGPGMEEIGHLWFEDSDLWAAKALEIEPDGSAYIFGNDINRGFDVYRFEASPAGTETMSTGTSRWLSPLGAEALLGIADPARSLLTSCLLRVA